MRKSKGNKRENGAVAVISMFIMTTLILLTAIVVDYGENFQNNTSDSFRLETTAHMFKYPFLPLQ